MSCVTNLSYYALEGRARGLFADLDAVCVSLLAVTVHANHEAVSEAARAFGNFSRDEDARRAMRRLGVVEALVLLLGHPARDVVFAAAGALVNAAVDGRDVLWEHKAHEELVAVVRRAGVQDLDLAAVACKALHNLLWTRLPPGRRPELLGPPRTVDSDTLGELAAVADDDDFLAAAGALRTILRGINECHIITNAQGTWPRPVSTHDRLVAHAGASAPGPATAAEAGMPAASQRPSLPCLNAPQRLSLGSVARVSRRSAGGAQRRTPSVLRTWSATAASELNERK